MIKEKAFRTACQAEATHPCKVALEAKQTHSQTQGLHLSEEEAATIEQTLYDIIMQLRQQ